MEINGFAPSSDIFKTMSVGEKSKTNEVSKNSFGDVLKNEINNINDKQIASEDITQRFINGENIDVHNVMIAGEEAKLSLQLAVQVRNKLVEAYQEISRMQL